ncbi:unnamed protein product [Brassica oleracea var. botrytis]|uniref:(rape) hypothetical protein n=1 Tax=Brassica napus TaxID=3708 RepID=A0A816JEJ3_BRANA|nr:unnamed protein product [Brassica napus]
MAVSSTVLSCPTMLGRIRSTAAEMRTLRSGAKCQLSTTKPSKYSSKFSTDVQLHESPQALFDEYLEDKSRVFKAMFPDKPKSYRLNEMKWELQGLGQVMEQSDFTLGVQGALYPDRGGRHTRLKGRLEMNISFVLPPVLAFVPEDVKRSVANAILTGLVDSMKHKVIESMLADYNRFKNERKTHN